MPLMKWNQSLSVKIRLFDLQHMKLVDMINELHEGMKTGKGQEAISTIIGGLIAYTEYHFADEEQYMEHYGYTDTVHHKNEHALLVRQVQDLNQQLKSGQTILTLGVMMFLKDWLLKHIQGDDKKMGAFLNERGMS